MTKQILQQPLTRNHQLTTKDLQTLPLPLIIKDNQIIIEKSLRKGLLKHPITLSLEKVLAAKQIGLIKYVSKPYSANDPSYYTTPSTTKAFYKWQTIFCETFQEAPKHATPTYNTYTNTQHGSTAPPTR